jgi:hypothetical protein
VPTGRFLGRLLNSIDSTPVRSADLRLFFVDSARQVKGRAGDSLEVFVDTVRSRVASTDSSGVFAVRRLVAGRYIFQVRRIGFQPVQGALYVDSGAVEAIIRLEPTSVLLAKVEIKEMSVERVTQKLFRTGFSSRQHSGSSGTFIDRAEVLKRNRQTVAELLEGYGVHDGDIVMDRIPMDFESLRTYPADLVLGIEIYRHGRPVEFNGTRNVPTMLSRGGLSASMAPLTVIWTFIP